MVIEHALAANPDANLIYVIAGPGKTFHVTGGLPAMLAAVAAVGMTPLENRVALAGKSDVAGAAALLHQNVGGPAY